MDNWVRYCGYEIRQGPDGSFHLRQTSYIRDVLSRREISGEELTPVPKVEDADDEKEVDISVIREAQGLVGELMWISGRSRPDLSYGVSLMRLIHRRPAYVCTLAHHMLRYVNRTKDLLLWFKPHDSAGPAAEMSVFVDASFAPPHEGYRSVQGVVLCHGQNVVMWHSMRQPFITQSTAEAELLGYSEAHQEGESLLALLKILELQVDGSVIYGEWGQPSGVGSLLSGHRTRPRHLRLRAHKLREVLQCPNPSGRRCTWLERSW